MFDYFKKIDWILIISALLLCAFGLLSIYSSSLGKNDFLNFKKQFIFIGIGILLMFILSFLDWRILRESPYFILILYFICLLLLLGLFFFAPLTRGVRGWYRTGSFSVDPIEFTKIVLIILLAKYFSMRHMEMYRLKHILLSGLYVLLPSVLIIRQPNLGSAMILIFLWVGVLIISGIKMRHFLVLILLGLLLILLGWNFFLKDYQRERIISFMAPQVDPLGASWSQEQAKIAIGSGGIFGQGFAKGSQTQYGFLPEPQTDFIFSAIAEEFGLVGITIIFILFLVLIWRIMKIAIFSQSNFPRLFASGLAIIFIAEFFINVGMNLGILPVIGIPFPFVSYGGSGLIAAFAGLGILSNIKAS